MNADLDLIGTSGLKWIPETIVLVTFGNELASVPEDLIHPIRQHIARLNGARNKHYRQIKLDLASVAVEHVNMCRSNSS